MALDFSARASEAPLDFSARTKPKPKRNWQGEVTGVMANFNRGLGIGDELAAAGKTAANVFSGKVPLSGVGADYNRSMAEQRRIEDSYAADRPNAAALARGFGMAATAAVPAGNTANLFAQGGRAVNAARGATLAATQGAAYAAVDRGSARERLAASSRAARDPVTLGLGAVGGRMATPRKAKTTPKVDPNVELLAREGVTLMPGQMGGGLRRAAEDAGSSLPMVGDKIAEGRTTGFETFGRATLNRALAPVGHKLPDDIPSGTEAVKYAGDYLSKGYEAAVPGRSIVADRGLSDDYRDALANVGTLTPRAFKRLESVLNERVTSRFPQGGAIDGALYKKIQSELDFEVSRFKGSRDADEQAIGQALEGVQAAIEKAARRQDPAFAKQIDALDRGWAELGRIEAAAAKSTDLSGNFTPNQYAQSVRAGDDRVRRRGVARGEALSQDLARAGVKVLPSRVPDSGTAGRAAWGMVASAPGAVLGAMTGGGFGAAAGIAGTAATLNAASRLYKPEAIAAANAALMERISPSERQQALRALADLAANDPAAQELYRQVAARLSRAAGVAGGSQAGQSPNLFAQP